MKQTTPILRCWPACLCFLFLFLHVTPPLANGQVSPLPLPPIEDGQQVVVEPNDDRVESQPLGTARSPVSRSTPVDLASLGRPGPSIRRLPDYLADKLSNISERSSRSTSVENDRYTIRHKRATDRVTSAAGLVPPISDALDRRIKSIQSTGPALPLAAGSLATGFQGTGSQAFSAATPTSRVNRFAQAKQVSKARTNFSAAESSTSKSRSALAQNSDEVNAPPTANLPSESIPPPPIGEFGTMKRGANVTAVTHSSSATLHSQYLTDTSEQRLFHHQFVFGLTLDEAMRLAVANSPELKALNADVILNQQDIIRQDAAFDFSHFAETLYDQTSRPVGNNLDGAQNRLRTKLWNLETGVRKRSRYGGQLSLSQQLGHLNSNSIFINPNNQATGQLGIELEQPLARGASRSVNQAPIELAQLSKVQSEAVLRNGLQEQLLLLVRDYWNLVAARGELVQLHRSTVRAERVQRLMENRTNIDVLPQQLIRAKAAVARRKAEAQQASYAALAAQERLMRRMFGEQYEASATFEIVPLTTQPGTVAIASLEEGLRFGLQNHPQIHSTIQEIRSAAVQQRIAANDLLPQLDLIFGVFADGLRGNSDAGNAVVDQFRTGEPSFQIGLNYELPFGNRAARANITQRQIAIRQLEDRLQTVINDIALDIREQDILLARFPSTRPIRHEALELAAKELVTIETRQKFLLDGDQVALLYLDDLLDAQQRVQQAETEYLRNVTGQGIAQAEWLRAIGGLDQYGVTVAPPVAAGPD